MKKDSKNTTSNSVPQSEKTMKRELRLPSDANLPPIIREIVSNAPDNRKVPAFIASAAPLCAMCPRVRLHYYYDSRPSALLLQVFIEGVQSSGKSFAADIESLIMDKTLKARDKEMRRQEQAYREKKRCRRANDKLEEEPQTTVRVVPPTISKTVLTKRADFCEKVLGDSMTFWMFAEELAQVTDAGKNGYSNLRTIMRSAYDLGSLFGIDFASDNSYSAIVDINICSMFCATPSAIDEYFDKKAIEGGNITRAVLCRLDDDMGEEGAKFKPYTAKQKEVIDSVLNQLMRATYDENGGLQPIVEPDMSWLDKDVVKFIKATGQEAVVSGRQSLDVFRKRASVSAFRIAALCYYLYKLTMHNAQCTISHADESECSIHNAQCTIGHADESVCTMHDAQCTVSHADESKCSRRDTEELKESTIRFRVRQIYRFMANYIMNSMMERWGQDYERLVAKRLQNHNKEAKPRLFDMLPDTFTREDLKQLLNQEGLTTPAKRFIYKWHMYGIIADMGESTYQKTKVG